MAKIKKDRFRSTRGGNSKFINIHCAKCSEFVVTYQKDGPGSLIRCYLDRIFSPQSLVGLQDTIKKTSKLSPLTCPKCSNPLGIPMMYEPEKRFAYRMIPGMFVRKKNGD